MISGNHLACSESRCCKSFIELGMLVEWTQWCVAVEIKAMETMYEVHSGESGVNGVTLRVYRLEQPDDQCHLLCPLSH